MPGVVERRGGQRALATNVPGLEGRTVAAELRRRLGVPVTWRTTSTWPPLGEQWRGVARGVEDFVFLSVGTGLGAGLVLRGELHRGHHGAAGEVDFASAGSTTTSTPAPAAVSASGRAPGGGAAARRPTTLAPPFEVAARSSPPPAPATRSRRRSSRRRRAGSRCTSLPIAAVADVALVVLGGGIGANGDLLLEPIRELLAEWLPYPPRVEVSSLGEAAVITGALRVGPARGAGQRLRGASGRAAGVR